MVTIKLFAILKERAQRDELTLDFSAGSVEALLQKVSRECPEIADLLVSGGIMVSVNQEFARPDTPVRDGDEVALMPPFSGG